MAKAAPKRKAANGYKLAERLPKDEILEDIGKKKWKLGSPIGQGGFGEIYEAREENSSGLSYPYVIKIEPHTNGPLFVEMHFYMRNAKRADVEAFKAEKKLKGFGMPLYLGSGSHEFKNEKYRFVVMEKFGKDIWKIFLENDRRFPPETVFKLGIQILNVLEYIHKRGYVHADIKGANILMGITKGTTNQAYLVDFGLATKFSAEKEFKPNPKKAHDGTIEYLSRDAHKGVQTRRGDLEILVYNLIQWLGGTLPWEGNLKDPNVVHKTKEEYMNNVPKMINACFSHKPPPDALVDYLNYLQTIKFNEEPDYGKIRKIFVAGIKDAGGSENSPLVFSLSKKTPQKRKSSHLTSPSPQRKIVRGRNIKKPAKNKVRGLEDKTDDAEIDNELASNLDQKVLESDDENLEQNFKGKQKVRKTKKQTVNKEEDSNNMDGKLGVPTNTQKVAMKKTKTTLKNTDDQTEEADPLEGYTEAMKEIMMKKLKNGKSKRQQDAKGLKSDKMEGFTDSMKELAVKKREREAAKKTVKNKKAATFAENDVKTETTGRRLRPHKEISYDE